MRFCCIIRIDLIWFIYVIFLGSVEFLNNLDSVRKNVMLVVRCVQILSGIQFKESSFEKTIEMHTDQIIFELIKENFIEKSKDNAQSLTVHSGGIDYDEIIKKHSRALQYSRYYRVILSDDLKSNFDFSIPKLKYEEREKNAHFKKCNLNDYEWAMLETMEDVNILKYITDKRIVSVKKISNSRLEDDFKDYRKHFINIRDNIIQQNDSEFIKYSVLLFTTELSYHLESVYRLASKLSKYNNSRSKNKFYDDFIADSTIFNKILQCDNLFMKENSLILIKMQRIKSLTPENCKEEFSEYLQELFFSFLVKQEVVKRADIKQAIKDMTDAEIKYFIETHYNIWSILDEKLIWGNKIEHYIRNIYSSLIKSIEPPKIK